MAKTKYEDDFPLRAEGYAREGLNDVQIAAKLGISKETFYTYQNQKIDFFDALKRGKAPVDTEVENALLKRALGFTYTETTIEYETKVVTNDDTQEPEEVSVEVSRKRTIKHALPDTTAQIFWLKNRKPAQWREKKEVDVEVTTTEKVTKEDIAEARAQLEDDI